MLEPVHHDDHLDTESLHLEVEDLMISLKAEHNLKVAPTQPHCSKLEHNLSINSASRLLLRLWGNFLMYSASNKRTLTHGATLEPHVIKMPSQVSRIVSYFEILYTFVHEKASYSIAQVLGETTLPSSQLMPS